MGDLRENFNTWEFRCRCCGRYFMVDETLDALQALRDGVGVPAHILSGFRCTKHNEAVGGSDSSQHCQGRAADVCILGMGVDQMRDEAERIAAFAAGGIGIYPDRGFVHVDTRSNRCRWVCERGVYRYLA